jgi:hypothetical protein
MISVDALQSVVIHRREMPRLVRGGFSKGAGPQDPDWSGFLRAGRPDPLDMARMRLAEPLAAPRKRGDKKDDEI